MAFLLCHNVKFHHQLHRNRDLSCISAYCIKERKKDAKCESSLRCLTWKTNAGNFLKGQTQAQRRKKNHSGSFKEGS